MEITGKILTWKNCSPVQFIRQWETLARGRSARLYERHPGTKALTSAHLKSLYALWKERSGLTAADRKEVSLLCRGLSELNAFRALGQPKDHEVLDFYDQLSGRLGRRFSLKLFALHVALPRVFPPMSPLRFAAYYAVTEGKLQKRPAFTEALLPTYFNYQRWFFHLVIAGAADNMRVDKAILAVGEFLERYAPGMADWPRIP